MQNFDLGEVVRLDIYSIGVYQPMRKKAYSGVYNDDLEEAIAEATDDFESFTGSKFFGIAADILELQDEHIEAFIEGGWDKPRLRFLLEIADEIPGARGKEQRTVLTGYLDSDDVILEDEGKLIDDTVFTVNNLVQFTIDTRKNHTARKYNGKIINSRTSNDGAYGDNTITQSCGNSVKMITVLDLDEVMDDEDEEVVIPDIAPDGSRLISGRQNNAANYITDATKAINTATRSIANSPTAMTAGSWHDTSDEIISEAHGYLSEKGLNSVPILAEIALVNEAFVEDNTFTMHDLASVYNAIDEAVLITITDASELSTLEDSELLDDSAEAEIALVLAMSLPSIAFEHLMGVCEVDMDTSAEEIIMVTSATSIIPEYTNVILHDDFCHIAEHNLGQLIDSWENRYGTVYARAIIDSFGDSHIIVSLDGNAEAEYNLPQFADNSYTPLLAQDAVTTLSISRMLRDVSSTAYTARYNENSPLSESY